MTDEENFWDTANTSAFQNEKQTHIESNAKASIDEVAIQHLHRSEADSNNPAKESENGVFMSREPHEIARRGFQWFSTFLMIGGLATLLLLIRIDSVYPWTAWECQDELVESNDGTFRCLASFEAFQVEYEFYENGTFNYAHDFFGDQYTEQVRWASNDDHSILAFELLDWSMWDEWPHCEWEGDTFAGDTRWYCTTYDEPNVFLVSSFYCEQSGSLWVCTDAFGESENHSDTQSASRSQESKVYDCMKVGLLEDFVNQTSQEFLNSISSMLYPSWCFEPVPDSQQHLVNVSVLPFEGKPVVVFYDEYYLGTGFEFNVMQYESNTVRHSYLTSTPYDADGNEVLDFSDRLIGAILTIFVLLAYAGGAVALFTYRVHLRHHGSENTLSLMSSWFNRQPQTRRELHLRSDSYIRRHQTTITDSEGSSSTSTHYEVRVHGEKSMRLPNGFTERQLEDVTGLHIIDK